MKIKENIISTKPVLHGFMVVSWILCTGYINLTLADRGIHVCLEFVQV